MKERARTAGTEIVEGIGRLQTTETSTDSASVPTSNSIPHSGVMEFLHLKIMEGPNRSYDSMECQKLLEGWPGHRNAR